MSSCGAGRGRGWLNLAKNAEPPKPLGLINPLTNNTSPQANSEYQELIKRISEMNLSDDGILFNKKMQYIQNFWLHDCHNQEEVEASFEHLYKACLHDADLGSKLVSLVASRSFISQEIHNCNIRRLFLKHLQTDFENSNQLQTMDPSVFRNSVHMLGEFFSKARVSNGEPFTFLASPFLSCLELLLNSKTSPDLTLFTNQLFLNGSSLKNLVPEELTKLCNKIRTMLVGETQLVKEAKLWLLLALDLYNVRFGVLPAEVFKFYEDQLGSASVINFQRPHDALSIQTIHSSKILDSYKSNVSVLQISTSPTEAPQSDIQSCQFTNSEYNGTQQNSNFPKESSTKKEKTGRPILGSGARFMKNNSNEENGSWNNKQKNSTGRAQNKKLPPTMKNNKGWEHDDRFETDYN